MIAGVERDSIAGVERDSLPQFAADRRRGTQGADRRGNLARGRSMR